MAGRDNCSAEGCQVPSGGACIEGFDELTQCPNYSTVALSSGEIGEVGVSPITEESGDLQEGTKQPPIQLFTGNALAVNEAHGLTGERISTVVVLMGLVKSGKTTLLAELYERFCKGAFAGYLFSGSRTIMGFEQICYLSRAVSEGRAEDTDRTKRGIARTLLHLDLVEEASQCHKRLLISDLSGELFEEATLSSDNLQAIPYLRRADYVVVFADAEKLGKISERHLLLNQLLVLLRCCIEEEIIRPSSRLALVVSRHDLLPSDMDLSFFNSLRQRVTQRTADYFNEPVQFFDLAARPKSGPEDGYGIAELLASWLQSSPVREPRMPDLACSLENVQREIDKYALKVPCDEQ